MKNIFNPLKKLIDLQIKTYMKRVKLLNSLFQTNPTCIFQTK